MSNWELETPTKYHKLVTSDNWMEQLTCSIVLTEDGMNNIVWVRSIVDCDSVKDGKRDSQFADDGGYRIECPVITIEHQSKLNIKLIVLLVD